MLGVRMTDLGGGLLHYAGDAIREALPAFEKQYQRFSLCMTLVLTGVETRTSSPISHQTQRAL